MNPKHRGADRSVGLNLFQELGQQLTHAAGNMGNILPQPWAANYPVKSIVRKVRQHR
jgi:hypothetical protein